MSKKEVKITVVTEVEDGEVEALESKIQKISGTNATVDVEVEDGELKSAKELEDSLNDTATLQVEVEGMENIKEGFSSLKQGASEVGQQMGVLLDQAGQAEQNQAFLKIGFDKAGSQNAEKDAIDAQQKIQDIVAKAPGDDVAMNSILSSAVAKDVSLMDKDMQGFANSVSDYFAGAEVNGKHAAEAIQDVRSYINSGNVAELETTGVFNAEQLEQLKNIDSVGERVAKFKEMVDQSAYSGLGTADTLTNKFAEFDGMMAQSQTKLGGFFSDATSSVLDFALNLNDATGGVFGMGLALVQMASPLTESLMGLGQMATGIKAIKETADFTGVTTKLSGLKTTLMGVGTTAKNAALAMLDLGKKALIAGYNALKAAAMWLAEKVQLVASTLATYAMAAAQALLNLIMSLNPIMLVVIAIIALIAVLVYLYYNVDVVRQAIDNLGASIISTAQWIYDGFMNIVNTVGEALGAAWASITTFCGNMVSGLISAASNAVSGFLSYIQQIPGMVMGEFNRTLGLVSDFISSLPSRVWDMGKAIIDALKASLGIGSPGYMYYMVEGEFDRIDDLTSKTRFDTGSIGQSMVDSFNPNMNVNSNAAGSGGNSGTVINVYGDVDSKERVREIVEAVRKELSWDNSKAGRTV